MREARSREMARSDTLRHLIDWASAYADGINPLQKDVSVSHLHDFNNSTTSRLLARGGALRRSVFLGYSDTSALGRAAHSPTPDGPLADT
jgi:hypothetical protein